MKRVCRAIALTLFLAGCTTAQYQEPETPIPQSPGAAAASIDYAGVQHVLGMDRSIDQLGFQEQIFNTCQVGNGYPASFNCRRKYFDVIYFKLECRDSEGTVATTLSASDISPVGNSLVAWHLNHQGGQVQTDSDGYGQIRLAGDSRSEHQRLKLQVGRDFLFIEAGDIKRIVAPRSWCP